MKEVNIYIKESCDALDTKDGYYIAVMTTQGGKRKFSNYFYCCPIKIYLKHKK